MYVSWSFTLISMLMRWKQYWLITFLKSDVFSILIPFHNTLRNCVQPTQIQPVCAEWVVAFLPFFFLAQQVYFNRILGLWSSLTRNEVWHWYPVGHARLLLFLLANKDSALAWFQHGVNAVSVCLGTQGIIAVWNNSALREFESTWSH